ncbi:hypothetical protein G7062_10350 [Erysipelothrix sp. HDW6C]|uniref:neutral/alkaline non-lysosomal ceramidase N-terminal domain-containing protein n=1 Tax=Erysipelothrix sp. HDW6C TaxID=2714930 RepID=UPI00140A40F3|nr:neutral/alkaline non-lysosomal ceramidase N-terminal domain-containing protein [Erysipelothrix sp. HDW6C]QIK70678.1 hypothetical protein G7062_10350 [Erysipelothrix sp. HDW6C]
MKVGASRQEITPTGHVYLSGQQSRTHRSTGVLDKLYVSTLVINDGEKHTLFVSYDLIMLDEALGEQVKGQINEEFGINIEDIVLGFTHTHSGPDIGFMGLFSREDDETSRGYRKELVADTARSVGSSLEAMVDCTMWTGSTTIEGCYGNRNGKDQIADKEVKFIQFKQKDVVATIVNMACHPTVLGPSNYKISGDLFGVLRTDLQAEFGGIVLMTQGASGDMGNRQYRQGEDGAELQRIRTQIMDQLRNPIQWTETAGALLKSEDYSYHLSYTRDGSALSSKLAEIKEELRTETGLDELKLLNTSKALLESQLELKDFDVDVTLNGKFMQLGDILIVTVPAELAAKFGLMIKRAFPKHFVIVWGYTEYSVGYLVDKEHYGQSFESIYSPFRYGDTEEYVTMMIDKIKKWIH